MKLQVLGAIVVCLAWINAVQADPQQDADRKALLKLVSRLPRVDTRSVSCPPFDARFDWKAANGSYRADFRYRRPDRLEAMMTDDADGAPCVLYRDKTIMLFDPVAPKFVVASDYMLDFGFREGDDGKVGFGANIGFGSEHVQRLRIDIQQVMQAREGVLTDQDSTDSVIRLRQARGEWRDELELHLNEPPVCILKTFEGDKPEPQSSMTLTLFPADSPPLFTAPDVELLRQVMPVDQASVDTPTQGVLAFAAGMKTVAFIYHAVYSHVALRQPDVRGEMKFPGFSVPDWDKVARNKKELGPRLRDLCGLPARSAASDDAPLIPTLAAEKEETLK